VAFWIRKNSAKPESIYAPAYDDAPSPGTGPAMSAASGQVSIPPQMRSIDLDLPSQAAVSPLASIPTHTAPIPAAPPAPQNPVDDTEQSKLNLAAQLLAKGDKDLARALILSVISSTHGELKARAIQMLGQIR
jgi:FimV-like protein